MCLVPQLCPTLCNPMDVACQAPLSMGILQAWILECVAMPSSSGYSQPRDWTQVSSIAGIFFISWATGEACHLVTGISACLLHHIMNLSLSHSCRLYCTICYTTCELDTERFLTEWRNTRERRTVKTVPLCFGIYCFLCQERLPMRKPLANSFFKLPLQQNIPGSSHAFCILVLKSAIFPRSPSSF